jgi:high-affinity iron transporter
LPEGSTVRIRSWAFVMTLGAGIALAASQSSTIARADKPAPAARPAPDSTTIAAGHVLFVKYCQLCHGPTGHGDGPGSVALNPKPRNFTQPSQFRSKNDDEVFQVISKGGAARKLSAAMPPWGTTLKPAQIWQLIAFVRTFPARDSAARANAKP